LRDGDAIALVQFLQYRILPGAERQPPSFRHGGTRRRANAASFRMVGSALAQN